MVRLPTYFKPSAIALFWACAVAFAFLCLGRYASDAGPVGDVPPAWPDPTPRPHARHRLVLFLHPHCPCSRATVRTLDRLMTRCKDRLDVEAVLVRPEDAAEHWEQSALARDVAAVPSVRTTIDAGGAMARRFGAMTSGHAILYDPAGKLVFSGGITSSRGHEGENAGANAIANAVLSPATSHAAATPVYGCALATPFTELAK